MTQAKKKILLVDDEEAILRVLRIKLRVSGYEVVTACNGQQALELIETSCPDIVLSDIIMPGIDGFQMLEKLDSLPYVPVIAFSAIPDNAGKALTLGARAFIDKPFNVDHLVTEIQKVLDDHN